MCSAQARDQIAKTLQRNQTLARERRKGGGSADGGTGGDAGGAGSAADGGTDEGGGGEGGGGADASDEHAAALMAKPRGPSRRPTQRKSAVARGAAQPAAAEVAAAELATEEEEEEVVDAAAPATEQPASSLKVPPAASPAAAAAEPPVPRGDVPTTESVPAAAEAAALPDGGSAAPPVTSAPVATPADAADAADAAPTAAPPVEHDVSRAGAAPTGAPATAKGGQMIEVTVKRRGGKRGKKGKLGIGLTDENRVTAPGPCAEDGLRAWDLVLSIDGVSVGGRTLAEVLTTLPKHDSHVLSVLRGDGGAGAPPPHEDPTDDGMRDGSMHVTHEMNLERMSVKALKALILSAGLGLEGCIDKADLRSRAREAHLVLAVLADATLAGDLGAWVPTSGMTTSVGRALGGASDELAAWTAALNFVSAGGYCTKVRRGPPLTPLAPATADRALWPAAADSRQGRAPAGRAPARPLRAADARGGADRMGQARGARDVGAAAECRGEERALRAARGGGRALLRGDRAGALAAHACAHAARDAAVDRRHPRRRDARPHPRRAAGAR